MSRGFSTTTDILTVLACQAHNSTLLGNDNGTITRIISYELSHLAQQLACRLCSLAVVTLQLKQYQQ